MADTGSGMTRQELDHAFDDFYTTKPEGTGLGLSIVRRLILDLNGTLKVETEPGAGTRFVVELPAAPEEDLPRDPGARGGRRGQPGPAVRLRPEAGRRVRGTDRRERPRGVGSRHPLGVDCVILDLEMPGMDGFGVLRAMSQQGLEVPVIVYTGTGNYDRCIQAVGLGAYGFIDKAEPMERVVREVETVLERKRLRAEVASLQRQLGETSLIGTSPAIGRLREAIARVAPIPSPVLIIGESGSGKELVARDLHRLGSGSGRPLRRHQQRRPAREPDRERALRPRAGCVHRRRHDPEGRLRVRGARHPVPG